ncbi:hypothetical protein L596_016443 [Steinernema carpocapsae]|uniref:VWFA domain-containing protein n=1 Tax=Steinernema carpocapsae TaxID=34508 RepID=A0A4U5NJ17_STECR|nr:hypothetical protein L596_016443 [Steinernema carpocapsae]
MLVVHVDPPTSTLETIEIYSENDHFASAMEVRYNCSFEYFSKPFNCYDQVINVVINGLDKNFEPFRHWRVYECPKSKGGQTTIAPGTTTTLAPTTTTTPLARTNTKFDVFLFYDGSNDVKPEEYHDVVNMTMDIFKSFDMSRNGISFSVFEVQGPDGESPLMEYPLGRLSIPDTLRSALKTAEKEDNFLKTRGQTLAKNMKFIANYKQYMSNDPAFTGVSNKVAIYFTTNQKPPQEAADLAKTIRERSDNPIGFMVMAVAYPSDGLNKEALVKFTGGEECVFVAATSDDLPSISSKIADKIWDASLKTGGKYC